MADTSIFEYRKDNIVIYLLVYVDHNGNDPNFLTHFVSQMSSKLSLKDMGQLHYFLGVEV